jgi:beta-lactamase superfamily II metal-dependent hydrolase
MSRRFFRAQIKIQTWLRAMAPAIAGIGMLFAPAVGLAAAHTNGKLQIYVIDVEGGQSTLFVTPTGQSLLIDTGWPDHGGRDASRIVAAAKQAGISRIDYVLLTHFHTDHVGGVPQLVARIPVRTFIDHGPNRQTTDPPTEHGWELYQKVLTTGKYGHITPKPGDVLPVTGIHAVVVSSDGSLIQHPLPGGGEQNPYCAESEKRPADQTENARSLGALITFGKLKILDLGDLTWDKEMQLMCPVNRLGHVDILIVSHHGWYQSSSPALVDAITPVVALMDNSETKGGSTPTLVTLKNDPGLETLWQLHYSKEGGAQHNTASEFIANLQGTDPGNYFKLTAYRSGRFTVMNSRTQEVKVYQAKK